MLALRAGEVQVAFDLPRGAAGSVEEVPELAIGVVVIGFNRLGDGPRDAPDPLLRPNLGKRSRA